MFGTTICCCKFCCSSSYENAEFVLLLVCVTKFSLQPMSIWYTSARVVVDFIQVLLKKVTDLCCCCSFVVSVTALIEKVMHLGCCRSDVICPKHSQNSKNTSDANAPHTLACLLVCLFFACAQLS